MALISLLAATIGCAAGVQPGAPGDGGGGGAGSGGDMSDDTANGGPDNQDGDGGNGAPSDDGTAGDDSDDLSVAFRLDGIWDDNGRHVVITQTGTLVEGDYFTERYCDPETGPGDDPSPGSTSTLLDFRGTLNNGEQVLPGDMIDGDINVCLFGNEEGNGWILGALRSLTVIDENTMSGEWLTFDGEHSGDILLTREQ